MNADSQCGALFFQPIKAYAAHILDPPIPSRLSEWYKITECIRRGTLFSVTALTPTVRASLQFDPNDLSTGRYELGFTTHRHAETGNIEKIMILDDDDLDLLSLRILERFANRFLIITFANDRQGSRQVWFVGISQFRDAAPDET